MPSGRLTKSINCQMHINYFRTYLKTASGRIKDMVEIRQKYQGKGAFEQADLKGYVATQ